MKWIILSFALGCVLASSACRVGKQEFINMARVEHVEYWHEPDGSNSKAILEIKYKYTF